MRKITAEEVEKWGIPSWGIENNAFSWFADVLNGKMSVADAREGCIGVVDMLNHKENGIDLTGVEIGHKAECSRGVEVTCDAIGHGRDYFRWADEYSEGRAGFTTDAKGRADFRYIIRLLPENGGGT